MTQSEFNDLEICQKLAEIENYKGWEKMSTRGVAGVFNPINNSALCFNLMIKHRIELGLYGTWYGCFQGDKPKGDAECLAYDLNPKRSICLAIININEKTNE